MFNLGIFCMCKKFCQRKHSYLSMDVTLENGCNIRYCRKFTLSIAHLLLSWEVVKWKGFLSIFSPFHNSIFSFSYLFHQSNDFHPKIFTQVFVSVSNDADRARIWKIDECTWRKFCIKENYVGKFIWILN
jgi:hypothetical protein